MLSRWGVLTPEIRWRSFLPLPAFLLWYLSCRVIIFSCKHCYCTTISRWAAGVAGEQVSREVASSRGRQQVVVGGSGNRGGTKGEAIFRAGGGKNLKRQHSQANKKYHEIGALSFLWCSFRVKRIVFIS